MTRLHVNVDHVATLRQARGEASPDPIPAAAIAEMAGACGITIHLREDRRHIVDRDLRLLRDTCKTLLNLEMAATAEMIDIAREVRPDVCTLVPERREERTTEGGLIVAGDLPRVATAVAALHEAGIRVSLFITPEEREIDAARRADADLVELHTGEYAHARGGHRFSELGRLADGARRAVGAGMKVAAGHGLDYHNVAPVAAIPEIEELNIGHAIIARAVFVGLHQAVGEMLVAMGER